MAPCFVAECNKFAVKNPYCNYYVDILHVAPCYCNIVSMRVIISRYNQFRNQDLVESTVRGRVAIRHYIGLIWNVFSQGFPGLRIE